MHKIIGYQCMVDHGHVLYIKDNDGFSRTISHNTKKPGIGWRRVCPSILAFCVGMACKGFKLW